MFNCKEGTKVIFVQPSTHIEGYVAIRKISGFNRNMVIVNHCKYFVATGKQRNSTLTSAYILVMNDRNLVGMISKVMASIRRDTVVNIAERAYALAGYICNTTIRQRVYVVVGNFVTKYIQHQDAFIQDLTAALAVERKEDTRGESGT